MIKAVREMGIMGLLICIMPAVFQIDNILRNSILFKIGYLLIFLISIKKVKGRIPKNIVYDWIFLSIVYILFPLLSFRTNFDSIFYGFFILVFLSDSYFCAKEFCDNKILIIKGMILCNGLVISFQIITHFNDLTFLNIMGMFSGSRWNRAFFGYTHPNFAAMFIVTEILLFVLLIVFDKKTKKSYITIIALFIPLFATGSRTALISVCVFIVLSVLNKIWKLLGNKVGYAAKILIIFISILIIMNFNFDTYIENSSGRNIHIINNFQVLIDHNALLFGMGGGSTSSLSSVEGIRFSDNWYMTIMINSGVVGLAIMILYVVKNYLLLKSDGFGRTLVIMLAVYSLGENIFFVPGVSICWIAWVIILSETQFIRKWSFSKNE